VVGIHLDEPSRLHALPSRTKIPDPAKAIAVSWENLAWLDDSSFEIAGEYETPMRRKQKDITFRKVQRLRVAVHAQITGSLQENRKRELIHWREADTPTTFGSEPT
jgi:hypothetical protein